MARISRLSLLAAGFCTSFLFADPVRADDAPPPPATHGQSQNKPIPYDQAKFDEGLAAFDAGRYEEAYKIFSDLADHEDLGAMRNVAYMKRKGLGTDKDPQGARDLYYYVAQAGLPTAQYDYAEMLLDGEAGKPDPQGAIPWLVLASDAGHPLAQFRLGLLYEMGDVIPQDLFKAKLLYAAAAAHGDKRALARLSYLNGWPAPPGEPDAASGVSPPPEQPPAPDPNGATSP